MVAGFQAESSKSGSTQVLSFLYWSLSRTARSFQVSSVLTMVRRRSEAETVSRAMTPARDSRFMARKARMFLPGLRCLVTSRKMGRSHSVVKPTGWPLTSMWTSLSPEPQRMAFVLSSFRSASERLRVKDFRRKRGWSFLTASSQIQEGMLGGGALRFWEREEVEMRRSGRRESFRARMIWFRGLQRGAE